MATIQEYLWDSGNGQQSNEENPTFRYGPGAYTVSLRASILGVWRVITRYSYIVVSETDQNLMDDNYLNNPKSFHFGFSESHGFNWSENKGDSWVWPESGASIFETDYNGEVVKVAYDLYDDLPYIINTRDSENLTTSYLDKGVDEIATEIIFPEYTGELRKYTFSHVQTNIRFRAILTETDLSETLEIDASLITKSGTTPVETIKDASVDKEIVFMTSNRRIEDTNTRQLKIATNESKFQLMGYNSTFKVNDKSLIASKGGTKVYSVFLSSVVNWYSRGNYNLDRCTGLNIVTTGSEITGPDDRALSAYSLTSDMTLGNIAQSNGCLMFWYKGTAPVITDVVYTNPEYAIDGDWKLAYANGSIPVNLVIPSLSEVFDIRVYASNIETSYIDEYKNNVEFYLGSF